MEVFKKLTLNSTFKYKKIGFIEGFRSFVNYLEVILPKTTTPTFKDEYSHESFILRRWIIQ